jgi:GT2 family glycosyltransferase
MSLPLISVIIPVFNGRETIRRCLAGFSLASYPRKECLLVDDHSEDETVSLAAPFNVRIIRLVERRGAAHARNRGAEASRGEILLFLDADVEIPPDCLERVARGFDDHPDVAALFGSYDDRPGSPNFISQYKNLFHHFIHQTSGEEASTFWSACGAIRREAFFRVGKFSENCRMMEDIDLGYRLTLRNMTIRLIKDLQVKHLKHFSFWGLMKSDLCDRAIPWTILMWKHKQPTRDLNLQPRHKASAAVLSGCVILAALGFRSASYLWGIPVLFILFFLLNRRFYLFFARKKGVLFALGVVPLHCLYYFYSSLGFVVGSCRYLLQTLSGKG